MCEPTVSAFIFITCAKTTQNDLTDRRVEALIGALSVKEIVCDAARVFCNVAIEEKEKRRDREREKGRGGGEFSGEMARVVFA